jgi:hypothetical protein
LNSSYTSSYIINVDQNKKRKQSPRMRRRDCNLPLNFKADWVVVAAKYTTFAKYGRVGRYYSIYDVTNIAKSKFSLNLNGQ